VQVERQVLSLALTSFLALTFTLEDVTLDNGVRVITTPGPPALAVSDDKSVVVRVGDGAAPEANWPRPSPAPLSPPPADKETWQVASGAPELVIEWAAPPVDESLLLVALLTPLSSSLPLPPSSLSLLRRDGVLRLRLTGGWPPEVRRRLDAELERLASLPPKELPAVKDACTAWANPKTSRERADRLLQVTLATGNPRLYRELSDRCARLTVAAVVVAAKSLYRRPRRILLKTPVEQRATDP
jgi:hypothetical protein